MLKFLRYRYAKAKMTAYINDELPPQTRRFVGRLINDDERIYNEYIRQRQTKQDLERKLPVLGRPDAAKLDALWANIQSEISKPTVPDVMPRTVRPRYSLSYGVAMLVFGLILLVPLAFDTSTARALSQHDTPKTQEFTTPETPIAVATSVAVAAQIEIFVTHEVGTDLQNTPAPKTPGQ